MPTKLLLLENIHPKAATAFKVHNYEIEQVAP